jgi:hypothetical protein
MDGLQQVIRQPARPMEPAIDPAAWYAQDIADAKAGIFHWDAIELAEIEAATLAFQKSGRPLIAIERSQFPLPKTAAKLAAINAELKDGVGFTLIHGLPIEQYTREQQAILYLGLGSYIGRFCSQNKDGHLLGHVKDLGFDYSNPNHRAYHTRDELDFHADSCNVVGLLCLRHAMKGGLSIIVSSLTVYNEMLKRRPDLVAELIKPVARDRRGEVPQGMKPYYVAPFFSYRDGYLTVNGGKRYVESAQRFPEVGTYSDSLLEALDMYVNLCAELQHFQEFAPGDIQFLNNHVIMHSRTEYWDWPNAPERKRHLLRLWLRAPDIRPVLEVFDERLNGISVPGLVPTVPLDVE